MINHIIKGMNTYQCLSKNTIKAMHQLIICNRSFTIANTNNLRNFSTLQKANQKTQPEFKSPNQQPLQFKEHKYSQRAYTPTDMSNQLLSSLSTTKQSYQQILHQLSLYYNKLLPFDYDYFTESLRRLLYFQQSLTTEEILMLFDLAIEYKIDSLILEKHFVNELYCRVNAGLRKQIADYDRQMQAQLNATYSALQKLSQDHFEIIDEKYKHLFEDQNQNQEQNQNSQIQKVSQKQQQSEKKQLKISSSSNTKSKIVSKPIYNAEIRKKRAKKLSVQTLNRITKIFIDSNSKNIEFNKLLLEVQTIKLDQLTQRQDKQTTTETANHRQLNTQSLLLYTRLTVNLLQSYMTEYQSTLATLKNKENKYTHRSVKNIYKLQNFYYYEVAKMVEENLLLQKASNEQLLQFANTLSKFPIKRRSFRKSVGEVLIDQIKKRQLQPANLMGFFELSKFDNKLLQHFEAKVNKAKQLPDKVNINSDSMTNNQLICDESPQQKIFRMPLQLFKKVTKKKSKPKSKKTKQQEIEIDLTQNEEDHLIQKQKHSQNLQANNINKKID